MRIGVCDVSKLVGRNRHATEYDIETIKFRLRSQSMDIPLPKRSSIQPFRTSEQIENCKMGVVKEKEVKEILREEIKEIAGKSVEDYSEYVEYKMNGLTICGKLDAIEKEGNEIKKIIEIKNRRNYIYQAPHETDQILMYIYFTNLEYQREDIIGEFVQNLDNELHKKIFTFDEAKRHCEEIIFPLLSNAIASISI